MNEQNLSGTTAHRSRLTRLLGALGDLTRITYPQQSDDESYAQRLKLLCDQIRETVGADLTCLMYVEHQDGSRVANFEFASGRMANALIGRYSKLSDSERDYFMPEVLKGFGCNSSRVYPVSDKPQNCWLGIFWSDSSYIGEDIEEFLRSAAELVRAEVHLRDSDVSRRWLTSRLDQEKVAHARAREALEHQLRVEKLFRTIGNTIPYGVFVTDDHGFATYVSSSFLDLIGMTVEDHRNFKWKNLIHPEQRDTFVRTWVASIRTGSDWTCEYQIQSRNGQWHTIMGRASPFFDSSGRIVGFAGVNFDITDRKQAEERLKHSEEQYRQIVDVATEGIWKMDIFGKTTFTNGSLSKILGYSANEFESLAIWDLVDEDCLDIFRESWGKLRKSERQQLDCSLLRKDGSQIWGYLSLAPIRNEFGAVDGVLALVTDVDQRHRSEDELKAAKRAADKASEAKSQFLANMSHEIRTPLTAVLGFADLLLDENQSNEERRQCAQAISRNGQLLLNLVNDILDLSKVEAGKLDIEPMTFPVSELVEDLQTNFKTQAENKNLKFEVILDSTVPDKICSDPTRVRQILINIVGNAFKFTNEGYVNIKFIRENRCLVIQVADSGPGMSARDADRLFSPFTQADSSITRKYGGTGLGLVLSRNLARSLMGDVRLLHTAPGKGSTFEIRLPMDLACTEQREQQSTVREISTEFATANFKDLNILVVDDSPDNCLLVRRLLEPLGVNIVSAQNGNEGVEYALSRKFDVVFMDIQMPVLDGYQATKKLRAAGFDKPIVALTAHAMKEEREYSIAAGCTAHLAKPLDKQALLNTVWDCLHQPAAPQ